MFHSLKDFMLGGGTSAKFGIQLTLKTHESSSKMLLLFGFDVIFTHSFALTINLGHKW